MSFSIQWTDFPEVYDIKGEMSKITLVPELSQISDSNLFIEGDNYPVLKLLNPLYKNKINFIYIDPPYNTGNTFTYKDNFHNSDDSHSQWLSFMQRRLLQAKELLSENGCIFIAIDQAELYHLKLLCDQIFGEENFVNDFMWLHGKGKKDRWSRTLQQHTLCYAKNKNQLKPFEEIEYTDWAQTNADNDPRGNWFSGSISFTENRSNPNHKNYFTITSPSGKKWTRQWQCSKEEMDKLLSENKIWFGNAPAYDKVPRKKIFNNEPEKIIPKNIIDFVDSTRHAQAHLDEILGEKTAFDNPKPVELISHLIKITQLPEDALIMDFFAGSGTTFEAVCKLNAEDKGNRRCILVQKPEVPQKASGSFETISDLCWKRLQKNAETYGEKILRYKIKE
ncbi:MAG: site-specific DNA-methyltransferase [Treponema sp.]|nr:site-specific DNA-methyltransferase [Treponema sp.]